MANGILESVFGVFLAAVWPRASWHVVGAWLFYCPAADHGPDGLPRLLPADGFRAIHDYGKSVAVYGIAAHQDGAAVGFSIEIFDCDSGVFL